MYAPIALTWNEALSGILGSVSLACWIFLLVPQLLENYQQGSAEGVSITFLCIWALGDVTNLVGALWAQLVPTVVALAVYFCFSDTVLILQCTWYNVMNRKKEKGLEGEEEERIARTESSPLLSERPDAHRKRSLTDVTEDNMGLPGSRRRSSAQASKRAPRRSSENVLERVLEEPTRTRTWIKNTVSVLAIVIAGTAGWAIAWKTGAWRPVPVEKQIEEDIPIGAEVLGYFSAVCYLGARIPQIIHNQRSRSCEGLSLLFFLLSLMGNFTYGASILFHSIEKRYFLTNLPWLIGSLGTMVEDGIIFVQFHAFGEKQETEENAVVDGDD